MIATQRVAPELKKLRKKYGHDRERLNQEMMALYQANGINPLAGCLPLFAQMPIFFGLFYTVRGLTRRTGDVGLALGDSVLTGNNPLQTTGFPERVFNPDFVGKDTQMYLDLANATKMKSWGLDLAVSPLGALKDNFISGFPYLLLVFLVGLSAWYQQRQIQSRSSASMSEMPAQQQFIMKYMPFMLPIFSFTFPAALVFYFLTSNAFRVLTQLFITRKYYGDDAESEELIRPTKEMVEAAKKEKPGRPESDTEVHGSRRHVTNPPKKRKKKPPNASAETPKKGKVAERKEPQSRPTSKRVTPKKNNQQDTPGSRRRNKKKKR
jgi:YidC/Oxa1 family membrane protein insertase